MWRAFPYFAWRYGERGRAFGRSDAGYLVTLNALDEAAAYQQVLWLAGLLAPRGMPGLLLERQLESLGRTAARFGRPGAARLLALAATMRSGRQRVISASVMHDCEQMCRATSGGVSQRRGAGALIAAAVADRALGLGAHDEALVRWFCDALPTDPAWANACVAAHRHATDRAAGSLVA